MWISSKVAHWLMSDKDELTRLRTANELLTRQLATTQTNFDWLRMRVNQLESERVVLLEKAYDVKLRLVPEVSHAKFNMPELNNLEALFEDMGDEKKAN